MYDVLRYLGMILTAGVGVFAILADFHVSRDGSRTLTREGWIAIAALGIAALATLIATIVSDRRSLHREHQAQEDVKTLRRKLDDAHTALVEAKQERTMVLERTLTQVSEIKAWIRFKLGAWEIQGLERFEKEFPGCSAVPPDSRDQFASGFAIIDTSSNPRTRALQRLAREYDLRHLLGPVHISMVHRRNKHLFSQTDHKRARHKAFYAICASLPVLDHNIAVEGYEQDAANPHYLNLDLSVRLMPDHNQCFRSAGDFDEAEIKAVYSHFRSSDHGLPTPPSGCLAPVSIRLEIRGESLVIRFKEDASAAEDPDVQERWIAYQVTSAGTFFRAQETLNLTSYDQEEVPA